MRLNTKVVIDIATDEVVERESVEYVGPVAQAISGGGSKQKSESSSGNRWTIAMDKLRYEQERTRSPFMRELIKDLNRPQYRGADGLMYSTPEEAAAMTKLYNLQDIDQLMGETRRSFEENTIPMLTNSMTAAGYGRSGAVGKTIADAAMTAFLPVIREGRAAQADYAGNLAGIGNRRLAQIAPQALTPITSSSRSKSSSSGFNFGLQQFWG